jgi:hypothetical protein
VPFRVDNHSASPRYWQPAIGYLDRHLRPGFRVEVVPTASHWESYWLPKAGIPLARGWYKQVDELYNPTLYSGHLDGPSYTRWLHASAVAFVLLPDVPLDPSAVGPGEARVLISASAGLELVFRSRDWRIYRVPDPTPLVTGAGRARITVFTQTMIAGSVTRPGRYLLRSHFNPYLRLEGAGCIARAPDKMTWIDMRRTGTFSVSVPSLPEAVLDQRTRRCADPGGEQGPT